MQKDALLHELRVIGIRTVFLNIAVYLISGLVQGFTLSFALGLLLGTALLFVYLLLLSRPVARSVGQPGGQLDQRLCGNDPSGLSPADLCGACMSAQKRRAAVIQCRTGSVRCRLWTCCPAS